MKPDNYPLPWCDKLDAPYWQVNLLYTLGRDGWSSFQKGRPMSEIIPEIDKILEAA